MLPLRVKLDESSALIPNRMKSWTTLPSNKRFWEFLMMTPWPCPDEMAEFVTLLVPYTA